MKQLSDELIIEFRQGNPQAFETVFDSFRMRIFYFVRKMINDSATAEEITSDTFVKLYNLKENFTALNKIQSFLFITARNASIDFLKHKSIERTALDNFQFHEGQEFGFLLDADTNIEADVLQFVHNEIEKLPERSRVVFKLFYLEGLSVAEIAKVMRISPQTVSNQKTTALKLIRIKVLDKPGLFLLLLATTRLSQSASN